MSEKRSFTLDAMRGVAALSVVITHFDSVLPPAEVKQSLWALPNAYLGVDFFYMLSGFVLARAYEHKLKTGLPAWHFMKLRAIRLYPMFLLGISLGAINAVGQIALHTAHALEPSQAVLALAQNVLMLPDIFSGYLLFPMDMPAWTLFLEILVNLSFAFLLFRLRSLHLATISLACAFFYLLGHAMTGDGSLGWSWSTAPFGFARAGYAFPMGLILGRALSARPVTSSPLSVVSLLSLAWIFFLGPPLRFNLAFDILGLFILLPAVIWTAACFQPPKILRRPCEAMGDASYPLFAIHFPLLHIVYHIFVHRLGLPGWPVVIAFLPAAFFLSLLVFRRVDAPLRRRLSDRSKLQPAAVPVVS